MTSRKRTRRDHTHDHDKPSQKVRKYNSNQSKLQMNICDLPDDILEKIIGCIPFWHRPRLRKSCRRMRSMCDDVLIHEFNSAIFRYESTDPGGYEYAALTAIKDATWHYVTNGFKSVFCGTMLPLIWDNTGFSPEADNIKYFLKHFYRMVNEKTGNSAFSRLLYSITLMEILKKFKNSRLVASMLIKPNYLRIVLELHGPWVGILWSTKSACEPQDGSKLLMILCDMMIANSTHRAFKKVWECDSNVFVYGNDTSERMERNLKHPRTVFTLKISAPKNIISLLKSCLEDDVVDWPNRLPRKEFVLLIGISCKEALNWGCRPVYQIEIGPFSKMKGEYEEEEDDDDDFRTTIRTISSDIIIEIE